jgi:hypothetical protein
MRVTVQLPMCDLRAVQSGPTGRLRKPHWPLGQVGTLRNGQSEFVRLLGSLCDTDSRETGQWEGRAQHVSLANSVRFRSDYNLHLRRHLRRASLLAPWGTFGQKEPQLHCVSRRLYACADSPRVFAQFAFRVSDPRRLLIDRQIGALVDGIMAVPIHFKQSGDEVELGRSSRTIAELYWRATTANSYIGPSAIGLVAPGIPAIMVEIPANSVDKVPDDWVRLDSSLAQVAYWMRAAGPYEAWLLCDAPARPTNRNAALHISRFHSERVVAVELCRSLMADRLGTNSVGGPHDPLKVDDALAASTRFLGRTNAFGRNQDDLRRALASEFDTHGAVWDNLLGTIRARRPSLARNVTQITAERVNMSGGDWVGGDKVGGDKVGRDKVGGDKLSRVSDSNIAKNSVVGGSLTAIRQGGEDDLAAELEALAQTVADSGSDEASELYEALVEEMSGRRRKFALKSIWDGLVSVLPAAASVLKSARALADVIV